MCQRELCVQFRSHHQPGQVGPYQSRVAAHGMVPNPFQLWGPLAQSALRCSFPVQFNLTLVFGYHYYIKEPLPFRKILLAKRLWSFQKSYEEHYRKFLRSESLDCKFFEFQISKFQTLDIIAENPDKFRVVALAAGSNVTLLADQVDFISKIYNNRVIPMKIFETTGLIFPLFLCDQVKRFKPKLVAVRNESLVNELKEAIADCEEKPEIIPGEQGVVEVSFLSKI